MTVAVAKGIKTALEKVNFNWCCDLQQENVIFDCIQNSMYETGNNYLNVGYGGNFYNWLKSHNPQPYGRWGNGSAMRVSYAGWVTNSLNEAETLAEISARVTHNHPDGIAGAKVTVGCIYILRIGGSKNEIIEYVSKYYNMDFKLDNIRDIYLMFRVRVGTL